MRRLTEARSTADVMRWIIANEHHEGWWTDEAFHLRGKAAELRVPRTVHVPGMMEGDDFKATGRMYRPAPAGREALRKEGGDR